jgi:hypothetical protein
MHHRRVARAQDGADRLDRDRRDRSDLLGPRGRGLAHEPLRVGRDAPGLERALQDAAEQGEGLAR